MDNEKWTRIESFQTQLEVLCRVWSGQSTNDEFAQYFANECTCHVPEGTWQGAKAVRMGIEKTRYLVGALQLESKIALETGNYVHLWFRWHAKKWHQDIESDVDESNLCYLVFEVNDQKIVNQWVAKCSFMYLCGLHQTNTGLSAPELDIRTVRIQGDELVADAALQNSSMFESAQQLIDSAFGHTNLSKANELLARDLVFANGTVEGSGVGHWKSFIYAIKTAFHGAGPGYQIKLAVVDDTVLTLIVEIQFEQGKFNTIDGSSGMQCWLRIQFDGALVSRIDTRPDNYIFFLGSDYTKHPQYIGQLFRGKRIEQLCRPKLPSPLTNPQEVVIVGMAGRFPGAANINEFWQNLQQDRTFFSKFPDDRSYLADATEIRYAGFLDNVFDFDAQYFNMTPVAARYIDPQHRLLLETIVQCIESSGASLESVAGDKTALCLATLSNDFEKLLRSNVVKESYNYWAGTEHAMLPGRVASFLDIQGPTYFVNAECTGGIAALNQVVHYIQTGVVDQALVGASSLFLHSYGFAVRENGILSSGASPKLLSQHSDGQLRGEAVVALRLKSRAKAEQDGDDIIASITGMSVKNSGKSFSLISANTPQHASTILDAWSKAGITAQDISAIECNASGVREGDYAEIAALKKVTEGSEIVHISSVKGKIGHTEAASGLVSIVKMALQIRHRKLLKTAGVSELDPAMNIANSNLHVVTESQAWHSNKASNRLIGGINAFAGGGYNTHTVLAEPLNIKTPAQIAETELVFPFSAQSFAVLKQYLLDIIDYLKAEQPEFGNVAHTLQQRECRTYRIAIVANTQDALLEQLTKFVGQADTDLLGTISKSDMGDSAIASAWQAGEEVDWSELWPKGTPSKLAQLPVRQFLGDELAPPIEQSEVVQKVNRPHVDIKSKVYALDNAHALLTNHTVNKQMMLPGVAGIVFANQAVDDLLMIKTGRHVAFKNIAWVNPVTAQSELKKIELEIEFDKTDSHTVRFLVKNAQTRDSYLLGNLLEQDTVDFATMSAKATTKFERQINGEQCYKLLSLMGIDVGDEAQLIYSMEISDDDEHGLWAQARLRVPCREHRNITPLTAKQVHLVEVLDAALQSSFLASLKPTDYAILQSTPVPFAIDTIAIVGELTATMYVRVKAYLADDGANTRRFDAYILNAQQQVVAVIEGFSVRFFDTTSPASNKLAVVSHERVASDTEFFTDKAALMQQLAATLSQETEIGTKDIAKDVSFAQLGIDSALAVQITQSLEKQYGTLPKTLLYEHKTLSALTDFFLRIKPASFMTNKVALSQQTTPQSTGSGMAGDEIQSGLQIAIVGVSGQFPGAQNITEFADLLADGKVAISDVPAQKWGWRELIQSDSTVCKWGGFLKDSGEFDHDFFDLSAEDAVTIDPQEKRLLQQTWQALENASCAPHTLSGTNTGVYIASMYSDYQLFGKDEQGLVSSQAQLANRLSYFLDVTGPSMTLDTMCSSSFVALQQACRDLAQNRSSLSIVGAVNLSQHPQKYLTLSRRGMLSSSMHVDSFGEGADGYIPGEAIGVVVLKRLSDAMASKDHIYGVIQGIGVNNSGKSNGFGAPDPIAQQAVIEMALEQAKLSPDLIDYQEIHGSGTKLGDLIELSALDSVFGARETTLPIGCVKPSVGHCEAASGFVALTKCLLQFKSQTIYPTVMRGRINPDLNLEKSKVALVDTTTAMAKKTPQYAGISSFGAGGTNAYLIVQSAPEVEIETFKTQESRWPLVLSAKTAADLQHRASQLSQYLAQCDQDKEMFLRVVYTLQCGREPMVERVGWLVSSIAQCQEKLKVFLQGDDCTDEIPGTGYGPMLSSWLSGEYVNWFELFETAHPARVPLPSYPFFGGELHKVITYQQSSNSHVVLDGGYAFLADTKASMSDKVERLLTRFIENSLGKKIPSVTAPLANLGIGSLHIVLVVNTWQAFFGKKLDATLFYRFKNIRHIAQFLMTESLISAQTIADALPLLNQREQTTDSVDSPRPLSDLQAAFVVGRELKTFGNKVGSTIFFELQVPQNISVNTLQSTWNALVKAHDSLHTVVLNPKQQKKLEVVDNYIFKVIELSHLSPMQAFEALENSRLELRCKVFDLSDWPYFEIRAFEKHGQGMTIQCAIDEVVVDASSSFTLISQWAEAIRSGTMPKVPVYTLRDYQKQLEVITHSEQYAQSMDYWCEKLADMPVGPTLKHDLTAIDTLSPVKCLTATLPADLWQAVKHKAAEFGVTSGAVLLSTFCEALHSHSRSDAFCVSLTTMNRIAISEHVRQLVGLLAGSQVYLSAQQSDLSFAQRVVLCQKQLDEDANYPGISSIAAIRKLKGMAKLGRGANVNVVFSNMLDSAFDASSLASGWTLTDMMNTTPQIALDHHVFENEGNLVWRWYVANSLIQSGDAYLLFERYQNMLLALSANEADWSAKKTFCATQTFAMNGLQQKLSWMKQLPSKFGGDCACYFEFHIEAIDLKRLKNAWQQLVASQPALRGRFVSCAQIDVTPDSGHCDVEVIEGHELEAQFLVMCEEIRTRLLSGAERLKANGVLKVCTRKAGYSTLFIQFDLIAVDGPSVTLLLKHLFKKYHEPAFTLPTCAYLGQTTRTKSNEEMADARKYWNARLAIMQSGPDVLKSFGKRFTPYRVYKVLPWRKQLESLAAHLDVSVDCILLAAYGHTLQQLNIKQLGVDDAFAITTVTWGNPQMEETAQCMTQCSWMRISNEHAGHVDLIKSVAKQMHSDAAHAAFDPLLALEKSSELVCPAVYTQLIDWPVKGVPVPEYSVSYTPNVLIDCVPHWAGEADIHLQWDLAADDSLDFPSLFEHYCNLLGEWLGIDSNQTLKDDRLLLKEQQSSRKRDEEDSSSAIRSALINMAEDLI